MKMMKKAMSFLIAAGFLITLATPVSAESQTGSDQWQVAFDGQKMKANYTAADFADSFSDLQPGDTVSIEITLKNVCGEKADLYIQNNILDIFEEADAADGAYTYQLTYTEPGASAVTQVLYDSRSVGGESTEGGAGLNQINPTLGSDYLYLDTLADGEQARVTLTLGLDGETLLNAYQRKSAALSLYFAAEIAETTVTVNETKTNTIVNTVVKTIVSPLTSDGSSLPLLGALAVGAVIVLIVLIGINKRRKAKEER